ncbi:hypothetical protein MMC29_000626 [Sticta canariensis]|nr:hypothetical protein [Sticta canariensis]
MDKDMFYVIAGNMDLNPFSFSPVRGSRLPGLDHVETDHGASQAEEMFLGRRFKRRNRVPAPRRVSQGCQGSLLDDPLMKPKKPNSGSLTFGVGINAMKVYEGHLYFTNTDRNIFARVAIHEDGTSKSFASEVLTQFDSRPALSTMGTACTSPNTGALSIHGHTKRQKRMMEQTYRHPHIPEDVLDTGDFNALNKSLSASPRLVRKITDLYGTDLPESRTRALFAASVDESNEQFIRTFHLSLEPVTQVWVFQDIDDGTVWLGGNRLARVRGNIVTTMAPNVTDGESEPFGPIVLAWGGIHYGDKLFISTNGGTAQYLTGEYIRGETTSQAQISD